MDNSEGELLSMSLHELGGLKPSTWEHLGVTSSFSGRNVERERQLGMNAPGRCMSEDIWDRGVGEKPA